MIYLVGGPPKCGKTTLAKIFSKQFDIPWISADTLQAIGRAYGSDADDGAKYPHSLIRKGHRDNDVFYSKHSPREIVSAYTKQAKATALAIDMMAICEITDGNDYLIEGYQVEPRLVARLIKKYGKEKLSAVFLSKSDPRRFVQDLKKSTTPNDWILTNTKKEETLVKIAEMVKLYSAYFKREAKKHGFQHLDLSHDFESTLKKAVSVLHQDY